MMKRLLTSAACAAVAFTAPAAAQDVAIVNATVAKGDGSEPVAGSRVIVRNGTVSVVGPNAPVPANIPTIDVQGAYVTPGIVAAVTDLGLYDVGAVGASNDKSAGDARFNAALDVAPAINPSSQHVKVSRAGGVTRALVTPSHGNSLFAGQGAVIDLGADANAVMEAKAFQMANLGERGARLSGGSRTAAYVELENALREASAFASGSWEGEEALLTRADAAALVPVINGSQELYVEVERAADIRNVLGLKRTYPKLDLVLVGASEGWLVASEIAAARVPVIADALDDLPASFEQLGATQANVGRMAAAGVKVAIGRMSGGTDGHPRSAAQFAGNLVALGKVPGASGLSWGQAFATISSIPAEIAGHGGKFGVLKAGAIGDVVIWDGDPLEVDSVPSRVFIAGIEQPLDNHQSELAKRYLDLDESQLPKAYDW